MSSPNILSYQIIPSTSLWIEALKLRLEVPQADSRVTTEKPLVSRNFTNCVALLVQNPGTRRTFLVHDDGRPLLEDDLIWLLEMLSLLGDGEYRMITARHRLLGIPFSPVEKALLHLGATRFADIIADNSPSFDLAYRPDLDQIFILIQGAVITYPGFRRRKEVALSE